MASRYNTKDGDDKKASRSPTSKTKLLEVPSPKLSVFERLVSTLNLLARLVHNDDVIRTAVFRETAKRFRLRWRFSTKRGFCLRTRQCMRRAASSIRAMRSWMITQGLRRCLTFRSLRTNTKSLSKMPTRLESSTASPRSSLRSPAHSPGLSGSCRPTSKLTIDHRSVGRTSNELRPPTQKGL